MTRGICIGGIGKAALLSQLQSAGVRLNEAAQALFADDRFSTLPVSALLEIVELSVASLAFGSGATFDQMVAQAAV